MEGSGLQAPPESEPPRFSPQPVVQNLELSEKARVGADISVGLHRLDGIDQRHVLADHEEGQDNRGRAAYPHGAVDQHAVCRKTQLALATCTHLTFVIPLSTCPNTLETGHCPHCQMGQERLKVT